MLDCLMSPEEKQLRALARAFVREDVSTELLRAMDADQVRYPREYIEKAAARGLNRRGFDGCGFGRGSVHSKSCAGWGIWG